MSCRDCPGAENLLAVLAIGGEMRDARYWPSRHHRHWSGRWPAGGKSGHVAAADAEIAQAHPVLLLVLRRSDRPHGSVAGRGCCWTREMMAAYDVMAATFWPDHPPPIPRN